MRPLRAAVAAWTPGLPLATEPLHAIAAAWRGIVGEAVAAHSAPLEIAGSVLVVATRTSAWSQQLHFLSGTILTGVRALPGGAQIDRLRFRTAALRRSPATARPAGPVRKGPSRPEPGPVPAPAADAAEALARLRERVRGLRCKAAAVCPGCGTLRAAAAPAGELCAPCAGFARAERIVATERLLFLCPWLQADAVREHIPGLPAGEVERVRRRLLQRWWLVLERTRRSQRLSRSGLERSIASSYVLLQSQLAPDRITPAVVRNVLGPELERLLWPEAP